jgi:hypothetical protein
MRVVCRDIRWRWFKDCCGYFGVGKVHVHCVWRRALLGKLKAVGVHHGSACEGCKQICVYVYVTTSSIEA